MQRTIRYALLVRSFALAVALLGAAGCYGENPQQMLETAQFEELQRNEEHARELYERIIAKFPASDQAVVARARLAELSPAD